MLLPIWLTLLLSPSLLRAMQQQRPPAADAEPSATTAATPSPARASVLQITAANYDSALASHELLLINFYADWCHFSARLTPIFETAAARLAELLPETASVRLARVDCVREEELSEKCSITKFPTLRLYYRGHPLRQEYRGQRSVEALVAYVEKQYRSSIKTFNTSEELEAINRKRRSVIGFFESRQQPDAGLFELLAERYKNDCDFYIRVGAKLDNVAYTQRMPTVVFRPDSERTHAADTLFDGSWTSPTELEEWLVKKCVPLVREVDFHNVEEIIEERLPLLVLFHLPDDVLSVKDFKAIVEMQLSNCTDCGHFNFVTVDGLKFQHSIFHMGRTLRDMPIIAIDSLRFMYPYDKFDDMYIPGHLKAFIRNFSNHQRLHKLELKNANEQKGDGEAPPLSTFKHLGPSKHRYTLVGHDEL
ncbi:PREDICTED: endoplasmic reticulum resident protein 44-like [Drosophila arizonae]|uniref:Endoplasmic reticulum resident protein 44-like n=1 Tax=Drosophila arizonae TaxID=7263 RepID=A0ABM1NPY3_DROAR|nr:PREDICTED: endoplasmic reticulum resident protein 44-like [Drosophila arizonae]